MTLRILKELVVSDFKLFQHFPELKNTHTDTHREYFCGESWHSARQTNNPEPADHSVQGSNPAPRRSAPTVDLTAPDTFRAKTGLECEKRSVRFRQTSVKFE